MAPDLENFPCREVTLRRVAGREVYIRRARSPQQSQTVTAAPLSLWTEERAHTSARAVLREHRGATAVLLFPCGMQTGVDDSRSRANLCRLGLGSCAAPPQRSNSRKNRRWVRMRAAPSRPLASSWYKRERKSLGHRASPDLFIKAKSPQPRRRPGSRPLTSPHRAGTKPWTSR